MLKNVLLTFIVSFSLFLTVSASPVETFVFKNNVTRVRFQTLTKELRCPKCQNQDLADSASPIAADLRKKIYTQLNQGKSDKEIVDYLVDRYGDFVLYRPRVSPLTYVLWFGPAVALFFGVIVVVMVLRSRAKINESKTLSKQQQAKLDKILASKTSTSNIVTTNSTDKKGQ